MITSPPPIHLYFCEFVELETSSSNHSALRSETPSPARKVSHMQFGRPRRVAQLSLPLSLGVGMFLAGCTGTVGNGAAPGAGGSSNPGPNNNAGTNAGTGGGVAEPLSGRP